MMFEFDMIQSGLWVLIIMAVGEALSKKMKAMLPSLMTSSVLFLILTWSGIVPSTIIEDSKLLAFSSVIMMFIVIGMGISMNPKELIENWRVVALSAICYIGQIGILLGVISFIFDRNIALASLPGGAATALIIQERAREFGYEHIVVLSALLLSVQGFVACPLVGWMLRKEIRRYQSENKDTNQLKIETPEKKNQENDISKKNGSPYWSLLRLYAVAWLASRLELYTGISRYIICLFLGILLKKLSFFRADEMDQSKSYGMFSLILLTSVVNGFSHSTPEIFLQLLGTLGCILLVDVVGIFVLSLLVGKIMKFSRQMSFAIGLNSMIGFPLNMMLAQDIIDFMAASPEENKLLNQQLTSKMVIAGFTSVTLLSTIVAGLLVDLMK